MKYRVYIRETLAKCVSVEASSLNSAKEKVQKMYYDDNIELDYEDLVDVEFEVEKDDDYARVDRYENKDKEDLK